METDARPRRHVGRSTIVLLVVGGLLLLAVNVAATAFARDTFHGYKIPSEGMTPALEIGDRVLAEKLSYRLHDPRRGDVVVFDAPPEAATGLITEVVKRIVGLPGETIEGRGGRIYIDGELLDEPYLAPGVNSRDFGSERIPPGEYFVMGDNRQFSKDSVHYGPIRRESINGRMFLRYWPPGRVGTL